MTDFQLTVNQRDASDRHDLHEVVYLLSGMIPGRRSVPNQVFYWATRELTAPLGAAGADVTFEPMMSQPTQVLRSFGFEPGSQAATPPVPIPIRNLPFGHAESIIAAFSDDDYSFEDAQATLRVAYIRPGQTVNDLVTADFRPLVLNGFFGPPTDVKLDGFTLPLHPRNARRNQTLLLPELPGDENVPGIPMDLCDVGKMAPVIIGRPDGWLKPPTYQVNYRGFLASGHAAGETEVVFKLISISGSNIADLWTASGAYKQKLFIHYRKPLYEVVTGSYDPDRREVTVTLASALIASVPRGGYVEHRRVDVAGTPAANAWLLAAHSYSFGGTPALIQKGWLFADGSIRPAPHDPWVMQHEPRSLANVANRGGKPIGHGAFSDSVIEFEVIELQPGSDADPVPAVFYDPGAVSIVQQQPEFSGTVTAEMDNYGTGATGTCSNPTNAINGNAESAASFSSGENLYVTYNSAPSPFEDDDTTSSVLHVIAYGDLTFKNLAGSVTFGSIAGSSALQEYRFTQASARNFDETVRVDASGSGGAVAEVWWTHSLAGTAAATRTADVVVGETSGTVGEVLEYAELVMRLHQTNRGMGHWFVDHTGSNYYVDTTDLRWDGGYDVLGTGNWVPRVTPVGAMASLHALLGIEGDISHIDVESYDAAHQRFLDKNIRTNVYLSERPTSWFELERKLGEEFRCFFYYGPSGHQCHFLETPEELEASGITVRQTFRLPGVPGANTFEAGAALMTRTPVSELTNTAEAVWARDFLTNEHLRRTEVSNADSVSRLGVRRHAEGLREFDFHSTDARAVSGGVWDSAAQVSGILQVYADRQAYAQTRFTFDTSWIAHGIDRGSLIRITYPVSTRPPAYRNVVCEVESIQVSPLNAERFQIRARSLYKPTKGIDLATIWTDVFTASGDLWTTRIKNVFDTWSDYWSLPEE